MDVAAAVANLGISHSSHRSRAGWFRKVHSEHAHWGPSAPGSAVVEGLAIPVGCGRGGGGGAGREGRESRPPPEEEEAAEEALVVRIGTGGGGEEGEVGPVHRTTEKKGYFHPGLFPHLPTHRRMAQRGPLLLLQWKPPEPPPSAMTRKIRCSSLPRELKKEGRRVVL